MYGTSATERKEPQLAPNRNTAAAAAGQCAQRAIVILRGHPLLGAPLPIPTQPAPQGEDAGGSGMAPKRARGGSSATETPAEAAAAAEHARLRALAEGGVVSSGAPARVPGLRVPRGLRAADGGDILKRQARRQKKYLFVFPGTFAVPPGAVVGRLRGLDSRTPTLDIAYGALGRLRLAGALVFPRNALLTVKRAAGRAVTVVDIFETLVVFAEWAWLGNPGDNPGDVPRPLPSGLAALVKDDPAFAAAKAEPTSGLPPRAAPASAARPRPPKRVRVSSDEDEAGNSDVVLVSDSDEDAISPGGSPAPPASTRVTRQRKSIDYSKMFLGKSSEEEESDEDSSAEDSDDGGASAARKNGKRDRSQSEDTPEVGSTRPTPPPGARAGPSAFSLLMARKPKKEEKVAKVEIVISDNDEEGSADAPKKEESALDIEIVISDDDDGEEKAEGSTKRRKAAPSTPAKKKRRRRTVNAPDFSSDDEDFVFSDEEGLGSPDALDSRPLSTRKRLPVNESYTIVPDTPPSDD